MVTGVKLRVPRWPNVPYLTVSPGLKDSTVKMVSTEGHYLRLDGAHLAAVSPLICEALLSALTSCHTCHSVQEVVIFSELSTPHLTVFNHFVRTGLLPVQEIDKSLQVSFKSLGVDLNSLSDRLVHAPYENVPLLSEKFEDYLKSMKNSAQMPEPTLSQIDPLDPSSWITKPEEVVKIKHEDEKPAFDIEDEDLPLKRKHNPDEQTRSDQRSTRKKKKISYAEDEPFLDQAECVKVKKEITDFPLGADIKDQVPENDIRPLTSFVWKYFTRNSERVTQKGHKEVLATCNICKRVVSTKSAKKHLNSAHNIHEDSIDESDEEEQYVEPDDHKVEEEDLDLDDEVVEDGDEEEKVDYDAAPDDDDPDWVAEEENDDRIYDEDKDKVNYRTYKWKKGAPGDAVREEDQETNGQYYATSATSYSKWKRPLGQLKSNGERYFMKEIFYFPQEGDKDAKGELVKRDPSKPHQCTKCLRGFSSPFALKQHLARHEGHYWMCPICDEVFDYNRELIEHKLKEHSDKSWECNNCGKVYFQKSGYQKHRKTARCKKQFVCICCGNKYDHNSLLNKHVRKMGPYHNNKCPTCPDVEFKTWNEHKMHVFSVHEGKFPIRCKSCPEVFPDLSTRIRHMHFYHSSQVAEQFNFPQEGERDESKAFQCPKCIKGFNTKDQLRLHLLKHDVGSKPTDAFVCIECPLIHKIFKTQEELDDHKALVHGEEGVPKDCPHCGKSIEKAGRMERHIKICRANQKVMAEGGILCVTCGKWAETNTALKNHITTKGKFHNNKCAYSEQCPDVTFSTWQEHRLHVQKVHEGVHRRERCKYCPAAFESYTLLRKHYTTVHPIQERPKESENLKLVICDYCGKSIRKMYITGHIQSIHGEKKFECDQCDEKFTTSQILQRHVDRTHNIVPCEHCGKIFTKRQYERHYKSTHMPEKDKTYLCAICVPLKGFNYRNKFEEHMNVHNGEKPFKCKMCNAAYASSGNLCAHIRTTHKGIKRVKK